MNCEPVDSVKQWIRISCQSQTGGKLPTVSYLLQHHSLDHLEVKSFNVWMCKIFWVAHIFQFSFLRMLLTLKELLFQRFFATSCASFRQYHNQAYWMDLQCVNILFSIARCWDHTKTQRNWLAVRKFSPAWEKSCSYPINYFLIVLSVSWAIWQSCKEIFTIVWWIEIILISIWSPSPEILSFQWLLYNCSSHNMSSQ